MSTTPPLDQRCMIAIRKAVRRGPYCGHLDRDEPLVNPIRSGSGFVVPAKEDGMTKRDQDSDEGGIRQTLRGTISRAQLLTAAGAGLALAVVPGAAAAAGTGSPQRLEFPYFPQVAGTYTPEEILDILNIMDTLEYTAIAVHTDVITNATKLGLNALTLTVEQAEVAVAQYHVDFLESLGAQPLTRTFTFRTPNDTAAAVFASTEFGTTFLVAGYMTAAREFAELGQPTLVKYAFQLGATWAEHRSLARGVLAIGGATREIPANNKAFETDHFVYVRDLWNFLKGLGLFGGNKISLSAPDRNTVLAAAGPMAKAVVQQTPNNAIVSTPSAAVGKFLAERGAKP